MGRRGAVSEQLPLFRVIIVQLAATITLAMLLLLRDQVSAYSALLGGLVIVIPSGLAAQRFQAALREPPQRVFKRVLAGELSKLGLTGILFILVFLFVEPLEVIVFFGSSCGVLALNMLAPVLMKTN